MSVGLEEVRKQIDEVAEARTRVIQQINAKEDKLNAVEGKLNGEKDTQEKRYLQEKELVLQTQLAELMKEKNLLQTQLAELMKKENILAQKEGAAASPGSGTFDYLRRLSNAPSASTISPSSEQMAAIGPLIHNWRPAGSAEGLPPALTHLVFGVFQDCIKNADLPSKEALTTAFQLCTTASAYYGKEIDLTRKLRSEFLKFFEAEDILQVQSLRGPVETLQTDGALIDGAKYLYLVMEVKQDLGTSKHPNYQGALYFGKYWAQLATDKAYLTSCCPAFLVEVLGPHIRVSALAMLDRAMVCPLTPLLNLLWLGHDEEHFMEIARLLTALKDGINAIRAFQLGSTGKPQAGTAPQRRPELSIPAPYPMKKYSKVDAMGRGRLIYLAQGAHSPAPVVVKFASRYGLDVHRAWAALGFAPQVLRHETLPGGWTMVEMEYLDPADGWQALDTLAGPDRADAEAAALQALQVAHEGTGGTRMVHGDARPANCMVRPNPNSISKWDARFVDFEFSGVEGVTLYPALMNPEVPWHEDVGFRKALHQEHDVQLLRNTRGKQVARQHLRPVAGAPHSGRAAKLQQARPRVVLRAAGASWRGARLVRTC